MGQQVKETNGVLEKTKELKESYENGKVTSTEAVQLIQSLWDEAAGAMVRSRRTTLRQPLRVFLKEIIGENKDDQYFAGIARPIVESLNERDLLELFDYDFALDVEFND